MKSTIDDTQRSPQAKPRHKRMKLKLTAKEPSNISRTAMGSLENKPPQNSAKPKTRCGRPPSSSSNEKNNAEVQPDPYATDSDDAISSFSRCSAQDGSSSRPGPGAPVTNTNGRKPRKSYSLSFKQQVVKECRAISKVKVSKKYKINERTLRKWEHTVVSTKALSVKDHKRGATLRLRGGGRRTVLSEAQEDEIYKWVVAAQEDNLIVPRHAIAAKAKSIVVRDGADAAFKASDTWTDGFIARKKLTGTPGLSRFFTKNGPSSRPAPEAPVANHSATVDVLTAPANDRKTRKSYSLSFKQQIIEECHATSKVKVSKKYNIGESALRKWEHTVVSAKALSVDDHERGKTMRLSGAGRRTVLSEAQEDEIYYWVIAAQEENPIVSKDTIAAKARSIAARDGVDGSFKATAKWTRGFMARKKLSGIPNLSRSSKDGSSSRPAAGAPAAKNNGKGNSLAAPANGRNTRKSYSLSFKQQIIEECHATSKVKVSKKYNIGESTLRKWEHTVVSAKALSVDDHKRGATMRLRGAGRRTVLSQAQEDEIYHWVIAAQEENPIVSRDAIAAKAKSIAVRDGVDGSFKASKRWTHGFMARKKLAAVRSGTPPPPPPAAAAARPVTATIPRRCRDAAQDGSAADYWMI